MKIIRVLLAGVWITVSEFIRNQFLLVHVWENHYNSIGLKFVTQPINGVFWMIWSFGFAFFLYNMNKKMGFISTLIISWIIGFPMMWITLFNLQVLPLNTLFLAIPLSIFEVLLALCIIVKPSIKR